MNDQGYLIIIAILTLMLLTILVILILKRKPVIKNDYTNQIENIKHQEQLKLELALLLEKNNQQYKDQLTLFKESMAQNIDFNLTKINDKVEERLHKGFLSNNETFQKIIEQLSKISTTQNQLDKLNESVLTFNKILSDKKTRGIFGETQLNQILSNIFGDNKVLYEIQKELSNKMVADAIIYAPAPLGNIVVDSKFPLENYQKLNDRSISATEKQNYEKLFKNDVKKHINDIATKYIIANETSPQAIMFVPAESIFIEIQSNSEELLNYAQTKNVWIASASTLVYMLTNIQMVVKGINQDKNAKEIRVELEKLAEEVNRFIRRWEQLKSQVETVKKTMELVDISAGKIERKFNDISDVKFDEQQTGKID